MLKRIVHFSLRFRGVDVVLACVVGGYGLYVAAHSKLDVFPDFAPPHVVIQTEATGLSPEKVEAVVPSIAKVETFGGEVRQIQVQVRPDRLVDYGLALEDVLAAARQSTAVRGAGFVENAAQRIVLRTEGQSLTPQQLGEVVLAHHDGVSVCLKDVAKVVEGPEPKFGDAQIMGQRGVVVEVYGQYGANTVEVTRALVH